jgi:hypothetical protein
MRVLQVHDILDLTKSAYKKTILPAMGLPTNWRNRVHGTILDGYALHVNYPGYSSKVRGSCARDDTVSPPGRSWMSLLFVHVLRIRRT